MRRLSIWLVSCGPERKFHAAGHEISRRMRSFSRPDTPILFSHQKRLPSDFPVNELNEPPKPIPRHLPAKRALVVQFRPAMPDGSVAFQGRVEHIASGRAEYFSDERELRKAFTELLSHD